MTAAVAGAPLAARDDDHAFLVPLVEQAAREARMRLEEQAGPTFGALLGGSLARGEGTVWRDGARVRALSDVDLAIVFGDAAGRDRARAIAGDVARGLSRRLRRCGMLGPIDLGVYAVDDLPRQERRPGTLEMRRSGRVLWGPPDLPARYPVMDERDVPRDEAEVLLGNRGIELLHAWPGAIPADDADGQLVGMYAGMKAVLDAAFAFVVAHGRCPATLEARQAALENLAVEGRSEGPGAVLPDLWEKAAFWGEMKRAPDPSAIALRLGAPGASDLAALARRAWREGARAHVLVSRALAAHGRHGAHRARLRRRVRRWWEEGRRFAALERAGRAPWPLRPWPARARLVVGGAPEHQLAACGAALLAGWSSAGTEWRTTMERTFPGALPSRLEWDPCRVAVVRLWDGMSMGGTRTAWDEDRPEPIADSGEES